MKTYDVAIIGSGPAGAMAAKEIASKDHSVLLLDRKKHIGIPVQCGEAITKYALNHVQIPIDHQWIQQSVQGVKILLPHDKAFYSTVPGYSIDRQKFDEHLANQAVKQGAELHLETTMKHISKSQNQWKIQTNQGDFQAKMLVGADGPDSKTATILGLVQKKIYIKAFQYRFHTQDISFPITDWLCMHMDERYRGGYGWIFPNKDYYNIGIGSLHGTIDMLHQLCKDFSFDKKKKVISAGGLVPYHFTFTSRVAENAVIIGDAAGLTNPVTGGGIHPALYSGQLAGRLICETVEKKDTRILKNYDTIINKSLFLHPIHLRTAKYFQQWNNDDWKFLGNVADGLDMSDLSLSKCFRIGLKHPKYLLRSRELLTIRKDMKINQKYGW